MEYAPNEGRNWRSSLQRWLETELQCDVFNPNLKSEWYFRTHLPQGDFRAMKSSDPEAYRQLAAGLVDLDCREIATRTGFVICYWDDSAMRGAGTKGELTIAKYFGKPVYLVTTMDVVDIPGWVLGCVTKQFASFEELRTFLIQD